MPWFHIRQPGILCGGTWEAPFYLPDPGYPDPEFVPQWPAPDTPRVDGRFRWLSEPLLRPMADRYWGTLEYSHAAPGPLCVEYEEYFWLQMSLSDPLTLNGDTGLSPYGSRVQLQIAYKDLPVLGVPGMEVTRTINAAGEADTVQKIEYASFEYNREIVNQFDNGTYTPATPHDWDPNPFRTQFARFTPFTHCYPESGFKPLEGPMPGSIITQLSKTANQVITPADANIPVIWDQLDFGNSSFWNIAGDKTKILRPDGINWMKFVVNAFWTAGGSVQIKIWKNGAGFVGQSVTSTESTSIPLNNSSTGWIPVSGSDYFQVIATAVGSAKTLAFGNGTSCSIEGTS